MTAKQRAQKRWYEKNRDRFLNSEAKKRASRSWYLRNRSRVIAEQKLRAQDPGVREYHLAYRKELSQDKKREYQRRYRTKNRDRVNLAAREALQRDVQARLKSRLRGRLGRLLRRGSAVRDLGCSVQEFKLYMESKFQSGMTWQNWGRGDETWQIDHIRPLCTFDLTDRQQLKQACHYMNLQPLWQHSHVIKSKIDRSLACRHL